MMKVFPMTGYLRRMQQCLPPLVLFRGMAFIVERMKTVLTSLGGARRASVVLFCFSVLTWGVSSAHAFSAATFSALHAQVTNDLAVLSALETPTKAERALLKALKRGTNSLAKVTVSDGKTLKSLNSILGRQPAYLPALGGIQAALLTGFNAERSFVENLLVELPESLAATTVRAQFQKFGPSGAKLVAAPTLSKFAGLYDAAKRKLDDLLFQGSQAALIPFPSELPANSVSAKLNNAFTLRTSASASSLNLFQASATETNLNLALSAVFYSGGTNAVSRGILFSVPNAALGTFRYAIPSGAVFTNRSGLLPQETEANSGATNGSIFISTTATEVYGTFSCSGPGFNITDGKFRVTLSSAP